MSVTPIAAVEALPELAQANPGGQAKQADFADWLANQVRETDDKLHAAEHQVQQLALGEADNLHQVMIALSKAKTSFELTVQVRNRLLEGFQEVMRMNI